MIRGRSETSPTEQAVHPHPWDVFGESQMMAQLPLYQRAYDAAHWHWRAAGILVRYSRQTLDATVMPSYAILASFSIELYLKTIYYIETKEQPSELKEHTLTILYKKLSEESRDAIEQYFDNLIPQYMPSTISLPEGATAFTKANAYTTDFDTTLRIISKAFVNFRYWYQKKSDLIYPSAAEVLRHALNRRIIDLVPQLISH